MGNLKKIKKIGTAVLAGIFLCGAGGCGTGGEGSASDSVPLRSARELLEERPPSFDYSLRPNTASRWGAFFDETSAFIPCRVDFFEKEDFYMAGYMDTDAAEALKASCVPSSPTFIATYDSFDLSDFSVIDGKLYAAATREQRARVVWREIPRFRELPEAEGKTVAAIVSAGKVEFISLVNGEKRVKRYFSRVVKRGNTYSDGEMPGFPRECYTSVPVRMYAGAYFDRTDFPQANLFGAVEFFVSRDGDREIVEEIIGEYTADGEYIDYLTAEQNEVYGIYGAEMKKCLLREQEEGSKKYGVFDFGKMKERMIEIRKNN